MKSITEKTALSRLVMLTVMLTLSACSGNMRGPSGAATLSDESIATIVNNPDRSAADRTNDIRRQPAKVLSFIGVRPGMVALDLSAGRGYTTELLARAVWPTGRVYGQNAPRNTQPGPTVPEGTAAPATPVPATAAPALTLLERTKNPATINIIPVTQKFENPAPAEVASNALDLATMMFNYHDLGHLGVDRAQMNKVVFNALKPGGIYVIADHSGRAGTGISESGTLHRVEEAYVRKELEVAGFRLVEQGNFLRNPLDPRDKNTPEPPQPKDEFFLKFVKP